MVGETIEPIRSDRTLSKRLLVIAAAPGLILTACSSAKTENVHPSNLAPGIGISSTPSKSTPSAVSSEKTREILVKNGGPVCDGPNQLFYTDTTQYPLNVSPGASECQSVPFSPSDTKTTYEFYNGKDPVIAITRPYDGAHVYLPGDPSQSWAVNVIN